MDIKHNMTLTFKSDEVKNIIIEYLEREGFITSNYNISFDIKRQIEGYGMMEHEVTEFQGITVKLN